MGFCLRLIMNHSKTVDEGNPRSLLTKVLQTKTNLYSQNLTPIQDGKVISQGSIQREVYKAPQFKIEMIKLIQQN